MELRTITTNGIRMRIAEEGKGPLVLLLHGFPESWYSWRHQLPALAAAGFHAVAPDQRGYGGTDAPAAIEAYDIHHLVADADGVPSPKSLPAWLTEADLDYFTNEFRRTGFRGGLNWYRNFDRNWQVTPELAGATVKQPALFVAGERDGVLAMIPVEAMREVVP